MRNHWWERPGWRPGRRTYSWFLTFEDQPQLDRLVEQYRQRLRGVEGLDLVPRRWLHLTVQSVAFTDDVTSGELDEMIATVRGRLRKVAPPIIEVTSGDATTGRVCDMVTGPQAALSQLRREARDGVLAQLCQEAGIELLVAFGSATAPDWPVAPRDLDLAVVMTSDSNLLRVIDALVTHLAFERVDVMDLDRAGSVARAQALGRGELLHEVTPGRFAELQILALVQQADTQWMRDLQLEALAR